MTISVNVNPPGSGLVVPETTRVGTINATFTASSDGETITSTTSTTHGGITVTSTSATTVTAVGTYEDVFEDQFTTVDTGTSNLEQSGANGGNCVDIHANKSSKLIYDVTQDTAAFYTLTYVVTVSWVDTREGADPTSGSENFNVTHKVLQNYQYLKECIETFYAAERTAACG